MTNVRNLLLKRGPIALEPVAQALAKYEEHRLACGYKARANIMTPPTGNHKLWLTTQAKEGQTVDAIIVGSRLNTFSDQPWEEICPALFERFSILAPPPEVVTRSLVFPYGFSLAPSTLSGDNWCSFSTPAPWRESGV